MMRTCAKMTAFLNSFVRTAMKNIGFTGLGFQKTLAVLSAAVLAACQILPSSGPSLSSVSRAAGNGVAELPKVALIDVDENTSLQMMDEAASRSLADLGGGSGNPDTVGLGDILEITLWEAPPAVLFGGAINSAGSGTAQVVKLPEQLVGSGGTVSVPFLGALKVSGKTPQQIQAQIVSGLRRKANQPQALVRVVQNNSGNVTVIRAGRSIRLPLTAHRERVLDAVAAVGGVEDDVRDVSLQLTRGGQVRTVALETVTAQPSQNIVLRAGDVLTMQSNPLSFTALGAVGKNKQYRFAAKGMNLGEALGEMGGLLDLRADARGVFVFRYQPLNRLPSEYQAEWQAKGYAAYSDVPVVYRVDLSDPQSMFRLQRFAMQDKDVVYVANSPATEVNKFLQLLFSPVMGGIRSISSISH